MNAVTVPDDQLVAHQYTASRLRDAATHGALIAGISSTHADLIYYIGTGRLAALVGAAATEGTPLFPAGGPAQLARLIVDRAVHGHGGFVVADWPGGPEAFHELLGAPDRAQVGGAMPHAAWALSEIGARGVMALRDRSDTQLDVLDDRIEVVTDGKLGPVGACPRSRMPGKLPHVVLEFVTGTVYGEVKVPRSTRLIIGFGRFGIERDDDFVDWAIAAQPSNVLVSGLAFALPGADDFDWISSATRRLRDAGIHVFHELTEFPSEEHLQLALTSVHADSLGMSLSELPGTGDPVSRAEALAAHAGTQRIVVHADDWSLSVHRGDPASEEQALRGGNLLAAARAAAGTPTADLTVPEHATFTAHLPPAQARRDGWRSTVVASPYLAAPAGTIGLGDTFTGGFLLTMAAFDLTS